MPRRRRHPAEGWTDAELLRRAGVRLLEDDENEATELAAGGEEYGQLPVEPLLHLVNELRSLRDRTAATQQEALPPLRARGRVKVKVLDPPDAHVAAPRRQDARFADASREIRRMADTLARLQDGLYFAIGSDPRARVAKEMLATAARTLAAEKETEPSIDHYMEPLYELRLILERAAAYEGTRGVVSTPRWHREAGEKARAFWREHRPEEVDAGRFVKGKDWWNGAPIYVWVPESAFARFFCKLAGHIYGWRPDKVREVLISTTRSNKRVK